MTQAQKRPRLLLPWFPATERDFQQHILETLATIIEKSGLDEHLVRINVSLDPEATRSSATVLSYKVFFNFEEEYWVESSFSDDGRYWWTNSTSNIGVGSHLRGDDLTRHWSLQVEVSLEALRRFLEEKARQKGREVIKLTLELSQATALVDTILFATRKLPKTSLTQ